MFSRFAISDNDPDKQTFRTLLLQFLILAAVVLVFVFRETLLGQLTVYIKEIREDFVSNTQSSYSTGRDGSSPPKGKNMPEIVNNIVWVRQLEAKASSTIGLNL